MNLCLSTQHLQTLVWMFEFHLVSVLRKKKTFMQNMFNAASADGGMERQSDRRARPSCKKM